MAFSKEPTADTKFVALRGLRWWNNQKFFVDHKPGMDQAKAYEWWFAPAGKDEQVYEILGYADSYSDAQEWLSKNK